MRLADPAVDTFIPLGETAANVEKPDAGEVVYAVGNEIRTRRWTWRQSDLGKITSATQNVFFLIDGFYDVNRERVDQAVQDLASQLEGFFKVSVQTGIIDREQPSLEWQ